MTNALANPPKFFRASTSRGLAEADTSPVNRTGGMFGFGLIEGVSVISRGEALGHDLWVDADFLSDVTGAINAAENGVKARFTHPGLSSDGMGKKLGRLNNAKTVGDQVFADLHFQEAATKTPDGNLAEYVLDLAEETPEDFGLSIVFEHDAEAMQAFLDENTVVTQGREIFTSPDEDNTNNYIHARLSKLRTGDVVDEPAANPNGLFSATDIPAEADTVLQYVLGLSESSPGSIGGIDAERMSGFVARFLDRHDLEVKAKTMPDENKTDSVDETQLRSNIKAEGKRFSDAFGEDGSKWFFEDKTFEQAQGLYIEKLEKQLMAKDEEIASLQTKLESLDLGEEKPAEGSGEGEQTKRTFASKIRIAGASQN